VLLVKSEIVQRLGEGDVLLPALIAEGLGANDKVKARFSVLQAAGRRAHAPQNASFDLATECRAAGLDSDAMEALIDGATEVSGDRVTAPGLDRLLAAIWDDVATMAQAVKAGDTAAGVAALDRLAAMKATAGTNPPDTLELARISRMTAIAEGPGDSLHRLVMDLHKALNQLAASHAEEIVAGAHAYGLLPEDRSAVEAFMRGVELTRKLKFDHPGLATTATRTGTRLVVQNDIGETDAHVVLIAVDTSTVTVTYTDVHLARAKFFTNLFRNFPLQWSGLERKSAKGLGDDGIFYLVTGRLAADNARTRDEFLEAVGASLVFLIDWNKARKALRNWVSKGDAIVILDWAARHRFGHRGFLELGGAELLASAVHHATPARIGFGDRLDQVLGRDAATDFLKAVLRISAEALLEGGSARLARDRIEAELMQHLQRVDGLLLAIVIRQAGLAREIASGIAQFVAEQQARRAFDRDGLATRARRIEEKADKIAIEARSEVTRFGASPVIEQLVNNLEQAIDELEQAAFIASVAPAELPVDVIAPLADLCAAVITGAEAAAAGAAAAADVPKGQRADSEDALDAIGRLIEAEHKADGAERALTAAVLRGDYALKMALAVLELARALERATDRLAGFGHQLRRHVLADLAA
jgi:uncharacterized protein Yka (UPF0111/DUF47 family)